MTEFDRIFRELDSTLNKASVLNLRDFCEKLLILLNSHWDFDMASICLMGAIGPTFKLVMKDAIVSDGRVTEVLGSSELEKALSSGGDVFIGDFLSEPNVWRGTEFIQHHNIVSCAGIRLIGANEGEYIGDLFLYFHDSQAFSEDFRNQFRLFSMQLSSILNVALSRWRYGQVAEFGKKINNSITNLRKLFEDIGQELGNVIEISQFYMLIILIPARAQVKIFVNENGVIFEETLDNNNLSVTESVVRSQETVDISHYSDVKDTLFHIPVPLNIYGRTSREYESMIFMPLTLRSKPLGVFSVQHQKPNVFSREDKNLLEMIANHLSITINSIQLFSSLRGLSSTGAFFIEHASEARDILDEVAKWICENTGADLAFLYHYEQETRRFALHWFGDLIAPEYPYVTRHEYQENYLVRVAFEAEEAKWIHDSTMIYEHLGANPTLRSGQFEIREKILSTAVIPLRFRNRSVGVLFLNYRDAKQRFDEHQRLVILGLASYASVAIYYEEQRLKALQDRVDELEWLQNIDHSINMNLDLKETLDVILNAALERTRGIGSSYATIFLSEPNTQNLTVAGVSGPNPKQVQSIWDVTIQPSEKSITRRVFESMGWEHVEDVTQELVYFAVIEDAVSELAACIKAGDVPIGAIVISNTDSDKGFTEEDAYYLSTLAGQAGLAIKNAREFERQSVTLESLRKVAKKINEQLDTDDELYDIILKVALDVTDADSGQLLRYDKDNQFLHIEAEHGEKQIDDIGQSIDIGVVGYAARAKQIIEVPDVSQKFPEYSYYEVLSGMSSELAIPLLEGSELELRGVINLESRKKNNFKSIDMQLLHILSDMMVISLQNAERYKTQERRRKRLLKLSLVDDKILDLGKRSDVPIEQVLDQVLYGIVDSIMELLEEVNFCTFHRYEDGQVTRILAHDRDSIDEKDTMSAYSNGIVDHVAKLPQDTTKPYYLTEAEAEDDDLWVGSFTDGIRCELAYRLVTSDDVKWVINLESRKLHAFNNEETIEILEAFARQAQIAIENANLLKVENLRKAQIEAIAQIAAQASILAGRDPQLLMNEIVKRTCEDKHLEIDYMGVFLVESDANASAGKRIVLRAGYGKHGKELLRRGYHLKYSADSMIGYSIIHKEDLFSPNILDETNVPFVPNPVVKDTRSEMALHLTINDEEPIGAITVHSNRTNHFSSSEDLDVFRIMASTLAASIRLAHAYERRKLSEDRLRNINEFASETAKLVSINEIGKAYREAYNIISADIPNRVIAIRKYEPERNVLIRVDKAIPEMKRFTVSGIIPVGHKVSGTAVQRYLDDALPDGNLYVPDVTMALGKINGLTLGNHYSILAVPIAFRDRLYGVITLGHPEKRHFQPNGIELIKGVADQLGVTIQRLEDAEQVKQAELRKRRRDDAQAMQLALNEVSNEFFRLPHDIKDYLGLIKYRAKDIVEILNKYQDRIENATRYIEEAEYIYNGILQSIELANEVNETVQMRKKGLSPTQQLISVHEIIKSLPPSLDVNIELLNTDDPPYVHVVPNDIRAGLLQLISNSHKAMAESQEKSLSIDVLEVTINDEQYCEIDVTDTGTGIPHEKWEDIFELGGRVEPDVEGQEGTGYGLYYARRRIRENGGDLFVKRSVIGQGTCFTIRLRTNEQVVKGYQ